MNHNPAKSYRRYTALWHKYANAPFRAMYGRVTGYRRKRLYYIIEPQDWVIRRIGETLVQHLLRSRPRVNCTVAATSHWLYNQIVHFGSIWPLVRDINQTHRSNHLVATVFHGREDMGAEMRRALKILLGSLDRLDAVVTACTMMQQRLLSWGVSETKLQVIPIGVEVNLFRPPSRDDCLLQRRQLGIPEHAICIGSFQKDGEGWGDGTEPKLIKGPDIFLEVVKRLSQRYPIFILLTGPARGYVKQGLVAAGIPFRHDYINDFTLLPAYYHALDLYLVTSREEGGPQALPESMAAGVPLVSTRVGMAPDMIENSSNGFIVECDDVEGLVQTSSRLIEDLALRRSIIERALQTVQTYDWSCIARMYYERIYAHLF